MKQSGSISLIILLFGVVISVTIGSIVVLTSTQFGFGRRREARETALSVAEAGIQYYRWHLAHNPDDYADGTGDDSGPYVHNYTDPQGGVIGQYSLEITPPEEGYSLTTIESTGWTNDHPSIKRKIKAVFGMPSLARYSFLHNANVWFGSGLTVHGRAHSNGGIRQDGINDSVISSAKDTYSCGSETGCSPVSQRPGVWGEGGPDELWNYPVTPEDFEAINVDFSEMRTAAQQSGVYRSAGNRGYHLRFLANGTVNLYNVTQMNQVQGYDSDTNCVSLPQIIHRETLLGNYSLATRKIFFLEDSVWVDGVVNGRATVVAARFPINNYNEDIWINGNITYLDRSGDHSLGLIAQDNITFVRNLPQDFEINAALLAQGGKIMRHYYGAYWCGGNTSYAVRDKLTIYGSVISNQKSYWNWGTEPLSGFEERDVSYDANLYMVPPPYFPANGEYEFLSWEEVNKD